MGRDAIRKAIKPKHRKAIEQSLAAKSIAHIYRRCVKARNIYAQPWPPSTPVESTQMFVQFIRAATMVKDLNADPEQFVRAQFDCWDGPKNMFPRPSQLASEGAIYRFNMWLMKNKAVVDVTRKSTGKRDFALEERRLKDFAENLCMTPDEVLKQECVEFSRAFLKYKGVWGVVSKFYDDVHGEIN